MELGDEYDYTDTGVPLGYRYPSVFEIPVDLRPMLNTKPLRNFPKGPTGQRGPGARQGRDRKTFWCLSCESAVKNQATTWCRQCENKRNAMSRQASRATAAGRPTTVTLPIEVLVRLVSLSDAVVDRISAATLEFVRPNMNGGAIDDLMLATKDLAAYLTSEIRPEVQRARHPAATPDQVQRNNIR